MKKYIIILMLTSFTVLSVRAQATFKPGIRAGANFSMLTHTGFDYQPGFYAGGFLAMKFTRFYTLQPEITYSRQGAKAKLSYNYNDNENWTGHATQHISIGYLSFTMINKFTFNDQFDVHFGPTIDFQTNSNISTNSDVDLAFTAGLGYTLPAGLRIEARVKKGIVDVLDTSDYSGYNNNIGGSNTNFVFQVGLTYSFAVNGAAK